MPSEIDAPPRRLFLVFASRPEDLLEGRHLPRQLLELLLERRSLGFERLYPFSELGRRVQRSIELFA